MTTGEPYLGMPVEIGCELLFIVDVSERGCQDAGLNFHSLHPLRPWVVCVTVVAAPLGNHAGYGFYRTEVDLVPKETYSGISPGFYERNPRRYNLKKCLYVKYCSALIGHYLNTWRTIYHLY